MYKFNRSRSHRLSRLILEELESRTLLSAAILHPVVATPHAVPAHMNSQTSSASPQGHPGSGGGGVTNPNPSGYSPSQIQNAYGFNQISFNGGAVKGDGSGQTIAIVDAYNDPNITKDLAAFDAKYGLPAANLTVVNQNGGSKLPQSNSGWALEISLDVEWAHAMAPGANILLVEASNSSLTNLLAAVKYASQHASVVSMSWGSSEFAGETADDSYFTQPGVTFVASSGDNGAGTSWPAVSPNVVAVGGTSLTLNSSGGYSSETAWSGSGGGVSTYESKPSYQSSVTQSSTQRTSPDIAYNADPNTGYAVYDTVSYYGQTGWFEVGGTSAGAPQVSALVAIANQGRALVSQGPLNGYSQTLPALYNMSSGDYHDITSGSNGYSAGPGYDLATGRGTPLANLVVQALVNATSTGSVGSLAATNGSTPTSPSVKKADVLAGDPTQASSNSNAVSLFLLETIVESHPTVFVSPAQSITNASIFPFGTASVLSSAFATGPNLAFLGGNNPTQASAALASSFGLQFYAPAPKSISSPPPQNMGDYLSPFPNYSPDAVPLTRADDSEELEAGRPLVAQRTLRISAFLGESVLAGKQDKQAPASDAFFVDEASMAFLAEEEAEASEEDEPLLRLRIPALGLLGILASSFWMVPEAAEENRKRRMMLV